MNITQEIGRNLIIIDKPYFERVRFQRGEMYANYDLTITPMLNNLLSISHDSSVDELYLQRMPYYLPKFFNTLKDYNISISGLQFHLTNHKIHAVDTKPVAYDASLYLSLKALIKRASTKYSIKETMLKCKEYQFHENKRSNNFKYDEYNLIIIDDNNFYKNETLAIANNFGLNLISSNIKIFIESNNILDFKNGYSYSHTNFKLYFKKEQFELMEMINIRDVICLLIKNIYSHGYNLKGFTMYFSNKPKESYVDNATIINLEWALRNLLMSKENIRILYETHR